MSEQGDQFASQKLTWR